MGWVTMSERDLQRIQVLGEVLRGQRTITSAATVLALSARQVHRLLRRYREMAPAAWPTGPRPAVEQPDPGCRAGARHRAGAHELS